MLSRVLLFLALCASPGGAQTQYGSAPAHAPTPAPLKDTCPWLTQGSAARALGGDVLVTVDVPNTVEGSCRFSRQGGSSNSLEILVSKSAAPKCPTEVMVLRGIGNQAVRCKDAGSHGVVTEIINSRVRERNFSVTMMVHGQNNAAKTPESQDDALEQIAEQVAGNLY
jgi:hypothetical protein